MQIDPDALAIVRTGSSHALDALGASEAVRLPRFGIEPDASYRDRLFQKLYENALESVLGPLSELFDIPVSGAELERLAHEWRGPIGTETTPPEDEPHDTSVRDAVHKHW